MIPAPVFIQKDKGEKEGYDFCYIYKTFVFSKKYQSNFKYIIRAEAYQDCFAIKFYCSLLKHTDIKYSKIINVFSASEVRQLILAVSYVIPDLLNKFPEFSFCFMGSSSQDIGGKLENKENNQRFRIYMELARNLIGQQTFAFKESPKLSCCFFINKKFNPNIDEAEKRMVDYFYSIYDFEI